MVTYGRSDCAQVNLGKKLAHSVPTDLDLQCMQKTLLAKLGITNFNKLFNYPTSDRQGGLVVKAGGRGFDPRPRQTKVFKTGNGGFPPLALRNMRIALRLARQCQDNGLGKYWLKRSRNMDL